MSTGLKRTLLERYPHYVYSTAISPPSDVVALGTDGEITLIFLNDSVNPVCTMKLVSQGIVDMLEFASDGRMLVVSSSNAPYIPVYDVVTRFEVRRLRPSKGERKIIALSDNGRRLAAVCNENLVRIWDLETSHIIRDVAVGPVKWVNYIRFSRFK